MFTQKIKLICATILLATVGLVGCTSTYHQESTGQYIDSATITTRVKARLLADKQIKSFPITVNTYKHTVQLSGFVNNTYQKQRAVDIAAGVPGVEFVKDDLVVKAN